MADPIERRLASEGYRLASINARGFAYMIDDLLISLLFVAIFWDRMAGMRTMEQMMQFSQSLFVAMLVVRTLYQTLFVWLYGATLGKMALKIRIIDTSLLEKPTLLQALNRALIRDVSEMLFYLGFVWAFFDPLRQAWHDKTAKTVVIDA